MAELGHHHAQVAFGVVPSVGRFALHDDQQVIGESSTVGCAAHQRAEQQDVRRLKQFAQAVRNASRFRRVVKKRIFGRRRLEVCWELRLRSCGVYKLRRLFLCGSWIRFHFCDINYWGSTGENGWHSYFQTAACDGMFVTKLRGSPSLGEAAGCRFAAQTEEKH